MPLLSTPASVKRLTSWGFTGAQALETWQSTELTQPDGSRLTITAAPGTHARGLLKAALPPVMGSILEFAPATGEPPLSMYITGDTLVHDDLREIPRRHPSLDVGLWHLGGTRIPGFFGAGVMVTMDGKEGADLLELVRPTTTVPVHHDDYDVFRSPLSEFLDEVSRRGLTGVRPVARGEVLPLPV